MVNKKAILILTVLMTGLLGSGCSKENEGGNLTSSNNVEKEATANIEAQYTNDNVILATKVGENNIFDLYIKYPDKQFQKIASDIDRYGVAYLDGYKNIFYKDSMSELYLYNNGDVTNIAFNLEDFRGGLAQAGFYIDTVPFKISKDKSTIAYTTTDGNLYIRKNHGEKEKITSDIYIEEYSTTYYKYELSNNGEYIYYITQEDDLFIYNKKIGEMKIASGVGRFKVSDDGKKVCFDKLDSNNKIYLRDIEEDENKIIDIKYVRLVDIILQNEGDILFLSEFDELYGIGELYYYNVNGETSKIASDVRNYVINDNDIYYIGEGDKLYRRSPDSDKSEVIADNVWEYYCIGNQIYYLDMERNIYKKIDGKESEIICENNSENGWQVAFSKVNESTIAYINSMGELYLNDKKIDENVVNFIPYIDSVAYYNNNNEMYTINVTDQKKVLQIDNITEYVNIYYGNNILYEKESQDEE